MWRGTFLFIFFGILISQTDGALELKKEDISSFAGRVSKINREAALVRVRVDFINFKFINKKDKVSFWPQNQKTQRCIAYVIGKSQQYMLLRVPNFEVCVNRVGFTVGSYINFQSDDLKTNLEVASELLKILLRKRMALMARLQRNRKEIDTHIEKVDSVNKRYEVLRSKLELEWEDELQALQEDRFEAVKSFELTQSQLDALDIKIEKYRVNDTNLKIDRWAIDKTMYKKK